MAKHVPNWKRIDCPKCGKRKGENCYVEKINQVCCPERAAAAGIGRKIMPLPLATMDLGINPTARCRKAHHKACHGHHQRNHGLPGLLCTCSCHQEQRPSPQQEG